MLTRRWQLALMTAAMLAVVCVRLLPLRRWNPMSLYRGADDRQHVLLGDHDSYLWLRLARNKLDHGTTCDTVVSGACRDNHTLAPVGSELRYARSLHVDAIAALHRLITIFEPNHPLPATSFLVPVIVGALGALAAFGFGALLAGPVAGMWAAVLSGLHPVFLERSIGSDNDVWNVVLPLFMIWAGIAALQATSSTRAAGLAAFAGLAAALHAQVWSGWQLTFTVLLIGWLAGAVTEIVLALRRRRSPWREAGWKRTALASVVFVISTALFAILAGSPVPRWDTIVVFADRLVVSLLGYGESPETPLVYWPDVLSTVGELRRLGFAGVRENLGPYLLLTGWVGGLILVVQGNLLRRWRVAVGVVGAAVGGYVLLFTHLDRWSVVALLAAPIGAAWALNVFVAVERVETAVAGVVLIAWQLCVLFLACDALRYTILLVPPLAIGAAVAIGRLHQILDHRLQRRRGRWRVAARAAVFVALVVPIVLPVQGAAAYALRYMTYIQAAWWDTLTAIRDSTSPDTVVHTWWDNGYWTEYIADRRVSADGGTLATQVHYWLARALYAGDENESIGLLRMLDCGSDATPLPEGRHGAYGKLVAHGVDPAFAPTLVSELVQRDRAAAAALLAARSFSSAAIDDVLGSTHCTPPPAVLVLDTKLSRTTDWPSFAAWNFAEVETRRHLRFLEEPKAIEALTQRFELPVDEARQLIGRVRQMPQPDVIPQDVVYFTSQWSNCSAQSDGRSFQCYVLPNRLPSDARLGSVNVRTDDPAATSLQLGQALQGAASSRSARPALVLIAGASGIEAVPVSEPWSADVAVLFDVAQHRVLVGTPAILRSLYTQLMFLDGRYNRHFHKMQERVGRNRDRVVTWRVDWAEYDQSRLKGGVHGVPSPY